MLQFNVQHPPLALSSSKLKNRTSVVTREVRPGDRADGDDYPSYRSSPASPVFTTKRTDKRSAAYAQPVVPLSVSTALSPPSSPSPPSSSLSSHSNSLPHTPILQSAFPSPVLRSASPLHSPALQSKHIPRSPYVQPMPMAVPGSGNGVRSPHPLKSIPLPSPSLSHVAAQSAFGAVSSIGSYPRSSSSTPSSFSSTAVDVLAPGDLVGEGLPLEKELIRKVPIATTSTHPEDEEPAPVFEVVRVLGTGSYATVYLAKEVLDRVPSYGAGDSDNESMTFDMSMDGHGDEVEGRKSRYGREYAIKVLSKGNLDQEALAAQMFEARIHQSLPQHPNIVTLYRTLETSAYLLLLLEFVPGEDLFYFLEQARDHYEPADPTSCSPSSSDSGCSQLSESTACTPPTPSLLSTLSPSKLLSRTRLKLIASMFGQMCDAVAVCHERGVFHRDIKPENFIVTDGWQEVRGVDGQVRRERRVVVKLTDFGLSTTDVHSADMDCGSAPYMSYECRNNIHPTYTPRAADVWSLGIVLINMLYHYNPWTDTTEGVCPSFTLFRQTPTHFFLSRFSGMTHAVADFLATRVFCILPNPLDDSPRVSARAFGQWIRDLPNFLAPTPARPPSSPGGHARSSSFGVSVNMAEVQGHRLVSLPYSRRPSLRNATPAGSRNPSLLANQRTSWALSRAPSLGPAMEEPERAVGAGVPAAVPEQVEEEHGEREGEEDDAEHEHEHEQEPSSRSASTQKRRKRGARKGKGKEAAAAAAAAASAAVVEDTLDTLAHASQTLARELSRKSGSMIVGVPSPLGITTSVFTAGPTPSASKTTPVVAPAPTVPTPVPVPTITKKPSKWRLGFGKSNSNSSSSGGNGVQNGKEKEVDVGAASAKAHSHAPTSTAAQRGNVVNNVANLLDSLQAPSGFAPPSSSRSVASSSKVPYHPNAHPHINASTTSFASYTSAHNARYHPNASPNSSMVSLDDPRGRRYRNNAAAANEGGGMWGASTVSAFANIGNGYPSSNQQSPYSPNPSSAAASLGRSQRGVSPASVSQASVLSASTTSSNWRSGTSSAATSTSAFTRYSNGSQRSVSTAATSVSSASWRSARDPRMPANVKCVDGLPWELGEVPRQQYLDPDNVVFNGPPQRKRAPKPKNGSNLDTISERPIHRADPAGSTTELDRVAGGAEAGDEAGGTPRKVQKGQINALAKMLSALRR